MTVNVGGKMVKKSEKEVTEEKKEEVKINPADYWCDVILEKPTQEKTLDRSLPSIFELVSYQVHQVIDSFLNNDRYILYHS